MNLLVKAFEYRKIPRIMKMNAGNLEDYRVLLTELIGNLLDVLIDDLFGLRGVLVVDDVLTCLVVNEVLRLVDALLDDVLRIETHKTLLILGDWLKHSIGVVQGAEQPSKYHDMIYGESI